MINNLYFLIWSLYVLVQIKREMAEVVEVEVSKEGALEEDQVELTEEEVQV